MSEFGGSSAKVLEWLTLYKKLLSKKMKGLSAEEQKLLAGLEAKLAHLLTKHPIPGPNQRKTPRVDIDSLNLEAKFDNLGDFKKFYIKNISGGGVYIVTNQLARVGTEVKMKLQLPGMRAAAEVVAEVAWTHPQASADLPAGMGVKFLQIPREAQAKINELLQALVENEVKKTAAKEEAASSKKAGVFERIKDVLGKAKKNDP